MFENLTVMKPAVCLQDSPQNRRVYRERKNKAYIGTPSCKKSSWRALRGWVDKRPSSSCSGLMGEEVTFVERPVEGQRMLRFLKFGRLKDTHTASHSILSCLHSVLEDSKTR